MSRAKRILKQYAPLLLAAIAGWSAMSILLPPLVAALVTIAGMALAKGLGWLPGREGAVVSLWRPFPPGAQALVPPGFIVSRCSICGRGTVDAYGGMDPMWLREDTLYVHRWQHEENAIEPVLVDPSERDLRLNVARSLDRAARDASNPVARIRGIRQARSLHWPWLAWFWALLPE